MPGFVSGQSRIFREIAGGVTATDLQTDYAYARARDKSDKSLDACKFFINALYVALTRAIANVYVLERESDHPLLRLLNLPVEAGTGGLAKQASSDAEWRDTRAYPLALRLLLNPQFLRWCIGPGDRPFVDLSTLFAAVCDGRTADLRRPAVRACPFPRRGQCAVRNSRSTPGRRQGRPQRSLPVRQRPQVQEVLRPVACGQPSPVNPSLGKHFLVKNSTRRLFTAEAK